MPSHILITSCKWLYSNSLNVAMVCEASITCKEEQLLLDNGVFSGKSDGKCLEYCLKVISSS